jgi:hypothetical protein
LLDSSAHFSPPSSEPLNLYRRKLLYEFNAARTNIKRKKKGKQSHTKS